MLAGICRNCFYAIVSITISATIPTSVISTYIKTFNTTTFKTLVFVFSNLQGTIQKGGKQAVIYTPCVINSIFL